LRGGGLSTVSLDGAAKSRADRGWRAGRIDRIGGASLGKYHRNYLIFTYS
jgi:hypothetical protein